MFFWSKLSSLGGIKGALILRSHRSYHGKSLSQGWFLTSEGPLRPSLFIGFLWIILLIKSAASIDHPLGISFLFIWICFDRMWSLISFLDLPTYGLYVKLWNSHTYSSKHAFKGHDSYSEIVHWDSMILPAHDLRCYKTIKSHCLTHVSRCTRGILSIIRSPNSGNTKVSNSNIT